MNIFKSVIVKFVLVGLVFVGTLYSSNHLYDLHIDDADYIKSELEVPSIKVALLMSKISDYAYQKSLYPIDERWLTDNGFDVQHSSFFNLNNGADSGTAGFIVSKDVKLYGGVKKLVVISFRGTNGLGDEYIDTKASSTQFYDNNDVEVHEGFHSYFKAFREFHSTFSKDAIYIITGHSLGGAVAKLYGASLRERGAKKENVFVYTFGAPPVSYSGKGFVKRYSRSGKVPLNIIESANKLDPVYHFAYYKILGLNYLKPVEDFAVFTFKENRERGTIYPGCDIRGLWGFANFANFLNDGVEREACESYTHKLSEYTYNLYQNLDVTSILKQNILDSSEEDIKFTFTPYQLNNIEALVFHDVYKKGIHGTLFDSSKLTKLERIKLIHALKKIQILSSFSSFGKLGEEFREIIKEIVNGKSAVLENSKNEIDNSISLGLQEYKKLAYGTVLNSASAAADMYSVGSKTMVKLTSKYPKIRKSILAINTAVKNTPYVGKAIAKRAPIIHKALEIMDSLEFKLVKSLIDQDFVITDEIRGLINQDQAKVDIVKVSLGLTGDLLKAKIDADVKYKAKAFLLGKLVDIGTNIISGSNEVIFLDKDLKTAVYELGDSLIELIPYAGPFYSQYKLGKQISDSIDNKKEVKQAWENFFTINNMMQEEINVLGDAMFVKRLDIIINKALKEIYKKNEVIITNSSFQPSTLTIHLPTTATLTDKTIKTKNNDEIIMTFGKNYLYKDAVLNAKELNKEYRLGFSSADMGGVIVATYDKTTNGLKFNAPTSEPFTLNKLEYPNSKGSYTAVELPSDFEKVERESIEDYPASKTKIVEVDFTTSLYSANNQVATKAKSSLNVSEWTNLYNGKVSSVNEGLEVFGSGYRQIGKICTNQKYNLINNELYYKWKPGDDGGYAGYGFFLNSELTEENRIFAYGKFTTHHQYKDLTLIDNSNEYFTRAIFGENNLVKVITSINNYDNLGGTVIREDVKDLYNGGLENLDNAHFCFALWDNYSGVNASVKLMDLKVGKQKDKPISLVSISKNISLESETPIDTQTNKSEFKKSWIFSQDIKDLTVEVVSNTYLNTVTKDSFSKDKNTLSISLTPNTDLDENKLVLKFKDTNGNAVKVDYSDTFWAKTPLKAPTPLDLNPPIQNEVTKDNVILTYNDADTSTPFYSYIAFSTIKKVVWGQPDPKNEGERIFRPNDNVSWAEALAMVTKASTLSKQATMPEYENVFGVYPSWASGYYTFARENRAIDFRSDDLTQTNLKREDIARLLVKTLKLDERMKGIHPENLEFKDEDAFSSPTLLLYGKIVRGYGIFMNGDISNPQGNITRGELAKVVSKIFMMPNATINVDESVEYGESFSIGELLNIEAIKVDTRRESYGSLDSMKELKVTYVINAKTATTDSTTFNIGENKIIAVLENNGVRNFITKTFIVTFSDRDNDGVQDKNDKFPDSPLYSEDKNNNGIPDIIDAHYDLEDKKSTDTTLIEGVEVSIGDIIENGGYIPPNYMPRVKELQDFTVNEDFNEFNVSLSISDIDGDDLNITADLNDTSIITLNSTWGKGWISSANYEDILLDLNITSQANRYGTTQVTLTIDDATIKTVKTFNVMVNAVNDKPTISGSPQTSVKQDEAYNFMPTAFDVDSGDSKTFSITNKPNWIEFSSANGELKGTPTNSDVGVYKDIGISLKDSFGAKVSLDEFDITVENVNDAPTIEIVDTIAVDEDSNSNIEFTFTDVDEDNVTATINKEAQNGVVEINGTEISYTPEANFNGTDSFDINLTDGAGYTTTKTIDVSIANVNDEPSILIDTILETDEDNSGLLIFSYEDIDGDIVIATQHTAPTNGVIDINETNITYTPNTNYFGEDSFTLTLSDEAGYETNQTITVTVNPVNDPATIKQVEDKTYYMNFEDKEIALEVFDEENDALSYDISYDDTLLTIEQNSSNLTLSSILGESGNTDVNLSVTDSNATTTTTFNIKVLTLATDDSIQDVGESNTTEDDNGTVTNTITVADDNLTLETKEDENGTTSSRIISDNKETKVLSELENTVVETLDNGAKTTYSDEDSGAEIESIVDLLGVTSNKLEVDGQTTTTASEIAGAITKMNKDANGSTQVVTTLNNIAITAKSDGSSEFKVASDNGKETEVKLELPGATTTIKENGSVETTAGNIEDEDGNTMNILIVTKSDGSVVTKFVTTDSDGNTQTQMSIFKSKNSSSAGTKVEVKDVDGKLIILTDAELVEDLEVE